MAYGDFGTCLGATPTLVNYLLDSVNFLAGNLDAAGGAVASSPGIPIREMLAQSGTATYDTWRSRVGGFPEVMGMAPAAIMAAEIRTPGPGQIRAMFVSAGNPVVSTPGGDRLEDALDELDLMVSFDLLYVNETGAHADYILPGAAMYERDDFPYFRHHAHGRAVGTGNTARWFRRRERFAPEWGGNRLDRPRPRHPRPAHTPRPNRRPGSRFRPSPADPTHPFRPPDQDQLVWRPLRFASSGLQLPLARREGPARPGSTGPRGDRPAAQGDHTP